MQRACDCCAKLYEAKRETSRFCHVNCRTAYSRGKRPPTELPKPPDEAPGRHRVANALRRELESLGVAESYEGEIALGLADQLGNGTITGTQYVSLSKELDRRVESLRMKAERPDDPAKALRDELAERRASFA